MNMLKPYNHLLLLTGILYLLISCQHRQDAKKEVAPAGDTQREYIRLSTGTWPGSKDTAGVNILIRNGNALFPDSIDKAIGYYKQALRLAQQTHFREGIALASNNLVCCYEQKKEPEQVMLYQDCFRQSLTHIPSPVFNRSSKGHRKLLLEKYNYWANDLYQSGHPDSAAKIYFKTLKLAGRDDSVTYSQLATSYMGLGALISQVSYWESATLYFNHAEQLARKYKDTGLLLTVVTNKACMYQDRKDYEKALAIALPALTIAEKHKWYYGNLTHTIAACLLGQKKPAEALPYSLLTLEKAKTSGSNENLIPAYYVLGFNYVQLKQYKKAEQALRKGLTIADKTGYRQNITNALGQISVAYARLGDFEKAYLYRSGYSSLRDSLYGKENATRIAEINAKYQVAQKDKLLANKDKELALKRLQIAQQQKRQYLWIGGTLLLVLSIIGILRNRRNKIAIAKLKATLEGEEKERGRIARELHDGIVSRLSMVKMNFSALPQQYRDLNERDEFRDAVNQLEQSITELRTTSHNLLPESLERLGLIDSLHIYCDRISKTTSLDIAFQVVGTLPRLTGDFQLNVYRIIQEFVNNIMKHTQASHALIQFHIEENELSITIDDNGAVKTSSSDPAEYTGIGLYNLKNRIQMLHGSLEIETGEGTSVYIVFNLHKFIPSP